MCRPRAAVRCLSTSSSTDGPFVALSAAWRRLYWRARAIVRAPIGVHLPSTWPAADIYRFGKVDSTDCLLESLSGSIRLRFFIHNQWQSASGESLPYHLFGGYTQMYGTRHMLAQSAMEAPARMKGVMPTSMRAGDLSEAGGAGPPTGTDPPDTACTSGVDTTTTPSEELRSLTDSEARSLITASS